MTTPNSYTLTDKFFYFEDYFPGSLAHQKAFCHLQDIIGSLNRIESKEINPMTVRLISAKIEMDNINTEYGKFDSVHDDISTLNTSDYILSYNKQYASGSSMFTPVIESKTEMNNINWISQNASREGYSAYRAEVLSISMVDIHKAFYNFSYHVSSILDRIKREIEILYGLKPKKGVRLYLLTLLDQQSRYQVRNPAGQGVINQLLAILPKGCDIRKLLLYRNTIAHEGFISIQEDTSNKALLLQDDPNSIPTYIQSLDVKSFVTVVFSDLIVLVDKFYKLLFFDALSGNI